jgi:hypothetical protein
MMVVGGEGSATSTVIINRDSWTDELKSVAAIQIRLGTDRIRIDEGPAESNQT